MTAEDAQGRRIGTRPWNMGALLFCKVVVGEVEFLAVGYEYSDGYS